MAPWERQAVTAVVVLSAVGGAVSNAHPTANAVSDVVLAAALAALVALACSIARTWTWIVLAGGAAVCSRGAPQIVGAAAEVVAVTAAVRDLPARRVAGAMIGATSAQLLLRLGHGPFIGSTALVAGAVVAPVLWSGWRIARGRARTIVRRTAYVLGGLVVMFSLATAVALLQARASTNNAIARVRAGVDAAKNGDTTGAAAEFLLGADLFDAAHSDATSWWTRPAELIPLVGQQGASVDRLTAAGEVVSAAAARATAEADVNSMRLHAGRIDLAKVKAAARPLADVLAALRVSQRAIDDSRSPWLLWPLANRLDAFADQVARATSDADLASDAVKVAPSLLGADGRPRHYFVAFANPAEPRDLGGFAGG